MQAHYGFSERRASAVLGLARSTCRYRPHRAPATALWERLRTLAEQRRRFGYRRLAVLLCREGLVINVKRVYRLYRAEGLAVRRRRRKRLPRTPAMRRRPATRINQRWTMDFIEDRLVTGRRFRTFNVMDAFSRIGLASEVDTPLSGARVVDVLDRLVAARSLTGEVVLDNGTEFGGRALDQWAYAHGIALYFIAPGKTVQNAHIESFHGRFRDECLNESWFLSLADARPIIEAWRQDYNAVRPTARSGTSPPRSSSNAPSIWCHLLVNPEDIAERFWSLAQKPSEEARREQLFFG